MLTMVDKVVLYRATSASRSVVADVEHNADALTSRIKQSAFIALIFRYVTFCRRLYSEVSERTQGNDPGSSGPAMTR